MNDKKFNSIIGLAIVIVIIIGIVAYIHSEHSSPSVQTTSPQSGGGTSTTSGGITGTSINYEKGVVIRSNLDQPIPDYVYQSPSVDGVFYLTRWSYLEPNENEPDWGPLDAEIFKAHEAHKDFKLGIIGGLSSPTWVCATAQCLAFDEFVKNGYGNAISGNVPIPWDPNYLAIVKNFMATLSDHLHTLKDPADNQLIYPNVSVVEVSFINRNTEEIRLPAETSIWNDAHTAQSSDALSIWQSAGYTPDKVLSAWHAIANDFLADFPDRPLDIALIQKPYNAFPLIDNSGAIFTPPSEPDFTVTLLNDAISNYLHPQGNSAGIPFLAVQTDALNTSSITTKLVDQAHEAGAITGYQLQQAPISATLPGYQKPSCGIPCSSGDQNSFESFIMQAINADDTTFIEMYPNDVLAYPDAITAIHTALIAHRLSTK